MKKSICSVLALILAYTLSATPLNGAYTINPLLPASTTNFLSFSSALTYLTTTFPRNDGGPANSGVVGVSGPVTFTVSSGTYQGFIDIPAIPGISATNRVTFDGVNAANTIIDVGANNQATVLIHDVNYVTFKNFTVNNPANGVTAGIAIIGSTSNNSGTGCRISNCIINLPNSPNNSSNVSHGIVVASFFTTSLDALQADSILIDSNTVNGGYHAITIQGQFNVNYNRNMRVIGNRLNAHQIGLQIQKVYTNLLVSNNTVNIYESSNASFGIRLFDCDNKFSSFPSVIAGNKVTNAKHCGIYVGKTNSSWANPTLIYNNVVTCPANYGIYIAEGAPNFSPYITAKCYHNSINITGPGISNTQIGLFYDGFYFYSEFKNNIFSISPSAGMNSIPAVFGGLNDTTYLPVDYNIFYNGVSNILFKRLALIIPPFTYGLVSFTAADFNQTKSGGPNAINMVPPFISDQNLNLTNGCLVGANLTSTVTHDIDGKLRNAPSVIGAFEPQNDVSIDQVYLTTPYRSGLQQFKVRVKSNSRNTINSFTVNYRLNNGSLVSLISNSTLNCGDTALISFTGINQVNFMEGLNSLTVYTASPNGAVDTYRANDTSNLSIQTITKQNGRVLSLAGAGQVAFASKPSMIGDSAISVCGWVKLNVNNVAQKFISKSSSTDGFGLGIDNLGKLDAEVWTLANGNTPLNLLSTGTSFSNNFVPVNEWTHVAFTWKSGIGIKIYINGLLAGELSVTGLTRLKQSTADLVVGKNSFSPTKWLNGSLDELSIWNRELTPYDIKNYMHRTLKGTETGLSSYIQFNEPITTTFFNDLVSLSSGIKGSGVNHLTSTAPLGGDTSLILLNQTSGSLTNTNVNITMLDAFDNAVDVGITAIPYSPNVAPAASAVYAAKYWVIRPYGNAGVYQATLNITFPSGTLSQNDPALGLYRRSANSDGNWTLYKTATSVTNTTAAFTGIDTFGQFMIASNGGSPLPVTLVDYGVKWVKEHAQVHWKSASEINLTGYAVECSYNKRNYQQLAIIPSRNNGGKAIATYTFDDKQLDQGYQTFYYRIKSIDMDGTFAYSPVMVLHKEQAASQIYLQPNPFNDAFTISCEQALEGVVYVTLTNASGVSVYKNQILLKTPVSSLTIAELADLPEGIYYLQISNQQQYRSAKIVKAP